MTNQGAYIETLQKDKIRDTKVQIRSKYTNVPDRSPIPKLARQATFIQQPNYQMLANGVSLQKRIIFSTLVFDKRK